MTPSDLVAPSLTKLISIRGGHREEPDVVLRFRSSLVCNFCRVGSLCGEIEGRGNCKPGLPSGDDYVIQWFEPTLNDGHFHATVDW